MTGKRIAVSYEGLAQDVTKIMVAKDGVVHEVVRALVACGNVAREVWPPSEVDANNIFWPVTPITTNDIVQEPEDAFATLLFVPASGLAHYTYNNVPKQDYFLRPPPTNINQFLIRLDPVSGSVLGSATGVWLDIYAFGVSGAYEWYVGQSGVGLTQAVADVSVAKDDGSGAPEAGTIRARRVTFVAQVVGLSLGWTADPWDLEEIKVNETADCELRFAITGHAYGEADTSGNFTEQWSSSPNPAYTVRVDVLSGDSPSGAVLGVPLSLGTQRVWTLTATGDEDKACELNVTVTDDFATAQSKLVSMHSKTNTQVSDELVWTGGSVAFHEGAAGEPVGFSLFHLPDGRADVEGIAFPAHANYTWHSAAPNTLNANEYEVRVDWISGKFPEIGSSQTSVWHNASQGHTWWWQIFEAPPGADFGSFDVRVTWSYRRIGQASTAVTKELHLTAAGGV